MRRILRTDYDQQHLLPPSVEEWVGPQHPARYIREFVQELDFGKVGLKQPNETEGGECYATELLLAVWLYGYWRKIRTTRGLQEACRQDLGFVYLSGNHRPDHHALWRFWAANKTVLRGVFKQTVQVALKLKLVEMVTQVLDGTKIEAACSHWGFHDGPAQRRLLAKLEAIIDELEEAIEQAPPPEQRVVMEAQLAKEQNLRKKVREALAEIEAGEAKHVHREEKGARRMKLPGRNRFAYNAQVMVDAARSVITAQEVVNEENDLRQLWPMMDAVSTWGLIWKQSISIGRR